MKISTPKNQHAEVKVAHFWIFHWVDLGIDPSFVTVVTSYVNPGPITGNLSHVLTPPRFEGCRGVNLYQQNCAGISNSFSPLSFFEKILKQSSPVQSS